MNYRDLPRLLTGADTGTTLVRSRIRVLIVEDEAMLLSELKKHYRRFFEDQGFYSLAIEQCESGARH